MKRWTPAVATLTGLAAACAAYALFGPLLAGMVFFATLSFAAFRKTVFGSTLISGRSKIDPAAVRRYREEHPGTTIADAINAVADGGQDQIANGTQRG